MKVKDISNEGGLNTVGGRKKRTDQNTEDQN